MRQLFSKFRLSPWIIPLALLAICLLAYGLLIPALGYYQDDWHFVYYASTRGAEGLMELFNYDGHPMAAWSYILGFNLLGYNPVYWQIFSLGLRWLAVVTFWLVLHRIWPERRRETFTVAAIYTVYPLFVLQAQAVSYFEVWISHFFLALSFLLTVEGLKRPKLFYLFTFLAILAKIAHLFTSEYTWGLELIRPILIWLALDKTIRRRALKAFEVALPFLLLFGLALVWRGFFYQSPVLARSEPRFFDALLADPVNGISQLVFKTIPDLLLILFSVWFRTLDPAQFLLSNRFNLLLTGLIALSAAILWVCLYGLERGKQPREAQETEQVWVGPALVVGLAGLVFGLIPFYAAGYFIAEKIAPWNGRFVIGSMPGVALVVTALIEWLVATPQKRLAVAAVLISLSIGWQFRITNDFRQAWDKQKSFYEQWVWRAPGLAPNTALIAGEEVLPLMGDYPTSFALDTIYEAKTNKKGQIPYWFFAVSSNFRGRAEQLALGTHLSDQRHSVTFSGNSLQSLYFSFNPELGQCLWVFRPEYVAYKPLADELTLADQTAFKRIQAKPRSSFELLHTILGPEKTGSWCYFYQKAELARQSQQWETITQLWAEASGLRLKPGHGLEYLVFIEAAGYRGDWTTARELTQAADKTNQTMDSALCPLWATLAQAAPASSERESALREVNQALGCAP